MPIIQTNIKWRTYIVDLSKDNIDDKLKEYVNELKRRLLLEGHTHVEIVTEVKLLPHHKAEIFIGITNR